jgi:hypothetical protein
MSPDFFDLIDRAGLPASLQPAPAVVLPLLPDQLPSRASAGAPPSEGESHDHS